MHPAEKTVHTCIYHLRSLTEKTPEEEVEQAIKNLQQSVESIRTILPESKYCYLEDIPDGENIARHFALFDLIYRDTT